MVGGSSTIGSAPGRFSKTRAVMAPQVETSEENQDMDLTQTNKNLDWNLSEATLTEIPARVGGSNQDEGLDWNQSEGNLDWTGEAAQPIGGSSTVGGRGSVGGSTQSGGSVGGSTQSGGSVGGSTQSTGSVGGSTQSGSSIGGSTQSGGSAEGSTQSNGSIGGSTQSGSSIGSSTQSGDSNNLDWTGFADGGRDSVQPEPVPTQTTFSPLTNQPMCQCYCSAPAVAQPDPISRPDYDNTEYDDVDESFPSRPDFVVPGQASFFSTGNPTRQLFVDKVTNPAPAVFNNFAIEDEMNSAPILTSFVSNAPLFVQKMTKPAPVESEEDIPIGFF